MSILSQIETRLLTALGENPNEVAVAQQIEMTEAGYGIIPLQDFICQWAGMSDTVPAVIGSLYQPAAVLSETMSGRDETVLERGEYALRRSYKSVSLCVVGSALWVKTEEFGSEPRVEIE